MVFIHGGGFGMGSGSPSDYGPELLLDYGIVKKTRSCRTNIGVVIK